MNHFIGANDIGLVLSTKAPMMPKSESAFFKKNMDVESIHSLPNRCMRSQSIRERWGKNKIK